jgi:hypothetical protein
MKKEERNATPKKVDREKREKIGEGQERRA